MTRPVAGPLRPAVRITWKTSVPWSPVARRSVLIGGAVGVGLLAAGCTVGWPVEPAPDLSPAPDPLLAELADERR